MANRLFRSPMMLASLGVVRVVHAAPFQNLDFEQATIQAWPQPVTPWDAFQPIASATALPGWTVKVDDTLCNAVWGSPIALDETSVALLQTSSPAPIAIQGTFSVFMTAYADAPSGIFAVPPSLRQATSPCSQNQFSS